MTASDLFRTQDHRTGEKKQHRGADAAQGTLAPQFEHPTQVQVVLREASRRVTATHPRAPDQPTDERSQRLGASHSTRAFVLFETIIGVP